jgi:DNA sulfur modification protein DndC
MNLRRSMPPLFALLSGWDEEGRRLQMTESFQLTIDSLLTYGPRHKHWAIAYSGGKDSSTLVTLIVYLIESGKVPRPETLTVLYADTRMELLPLWLSAKGILDDLAERGIETRTVTAPLEKRFLPYILGRGVPPPNNNTLRWCTRQIKIDPMAAELRRLFGQRGEKILMLTGVRQGESAIRDGRIAMSCGRNGGECGQGWYQETMPGALCDTLAPLLHWRVCHVWEWLRHWAPRAEFGDWDTALLAEAYGGNEAEEVNARTGCVGCPLATQDTALDALIERPSWAYLAPLKRLRPLYRELRLPERRLRKQGGARRKDGTLVRNQQRMGPLTIEARQWALAEILAVQDEANNAARASGRPCIDLLSEEEIAFIRRCHEENVFPNKWTGEEPRADEPLAPLESEGGLQGLFAALKERV